MVQALKDDRAVTLLAWRRPDLAALSIGSSARPSARAISRWPCLRCRCARADRLDAGATYQLRTAILLRLAKRLERDVDVLLTGDNEADFGARARRFSTETFVPEFREVIAAAATSGG